MAGNIVNGFQHHCISFRNLKLMKTIYFLIRAPVLKPCSLTTPPLPRQSETAINTSLVWEDPSRPHLSGGSHVTGLSQSSILRKKRPNSYFFCSIQGDWTASSWHGHGANRVSEKHGHLSDTPYWAGLRQPRLSISGESARIIPFIGPTSVI